MEQKEIETMFKKHMQQQLLTRFVRELEDKGRAWVYQQNGWGYYQRAWGIADKLEQNKHYELKNNAARNGKLGFYIVLTKEGKKKLSELLEFVRY